MSIPPAPRFSPRPAPAQPLARLTRTSEVQATAAPKAVAEDSGSATSHLKRVPADRAQRERIRHRAEEMAARLDRSRPLARHHIESHARTLLADLALSEGYLGWTMVALASAFWRYQVRLIPFQRRLLLLPHCLRRAEQCSAEYDEQGLKCRDCGACSLSGLRAKAQALGYRVLIAEGSPAVIDVILRGEADAILGVACLDSLEKAFDKILLAGIPCMAVPLWQHSCRNTATDEDWVREMIDTPYQGPEAFDPSTQRPPVTYVHLLRAARKLFEPDELRRLLGPGSDGHISTSPIRRIPGDATPFSEDLTRTLAHDFMARGGKHLRPFITLAGYDAMTGGRGASPDGAAWADRLPDPVRRIALAIEVFHKASLVHDDIEDDDPFRYGQPTLHRQHGTPVAINVGDWLIGLGYRLVAQQRAVLLNDAVVDILGRLADAHTRLCEGQGAELAWRASPGTCLTPLEAIRIYALKTAPAFEAALYVGLRLAGPVGTQHLAIARFARHVGVGFQILNDLDDWEAWQPNKRAVGTDVLGGRPTLLAALAWENLDPPSRHELERLIAARGEPPGDLVEAVRRLYRQAGAYDLARTLVAKHRQRAHDVARTVQPPALAQLLDYLADSILDR